MRLDDKERLRGSPGEGDPEQAETEEGEAQKEAPERSRSRLGLVSNGFPLVFLSKPIQKPTKQ